MTPVKTDNEQSTIESLACLFEYHVLDLQVNGQWVKGIPYSYRRLTDLEAYMTGMGVPFSMITYEAYRPTLVANAGTFGFVIPDKPVAVTGKAYIITSQ